MERTLHIPTSNVTILNLPEGYEAEIAEELESYELKISGLNEFVEPLHQSTITGVIDVKGWMEEEDKQELKAGTVKMPVTFRLSEDITIKTPVTVSVKITEI